AGHYESFFLRANHPVRPHAFWIRYTLFSPLHQPENASGELWAIYFDGETGRHIAVREEFLFRQCTFASTGFAVQVGDAHLGPGQLQGKASSVEHTISWDLAYQGNADPLFLFPIRFYTANLPKAKSLVGLPLATFNGSITIDGTQIAIMDWVGSQNHNWG